MKFLGTLLMFAAVVTIAKVADWKPEQHAWLLDVVRWVIAFLFAGGVLLLSEGIKREVLAELREARDHGGPTKT